MSACAKAIFAMAAFISAAFIAFAAAFGSAAGALGAAGVAFFGGAGSFLRLVCCGGLSKGSLAFGLTDPEPKARPLELDGTENGVSCGSACGAELAPRLLLFAATPKGSKSRCWSFTLFPATIPDVGLPPGRTDRVGAIGDAPVADGAPNGSPNGSAGLEGDTST